MKNTLKSIPWSGVGFILASVTLVAFWISHQEIEFFYIILTELFLFFFCFYICDKESLRK